MSSSTKGSTGAKRTHVPQSASSSAPQHSAFNLLHRRLAPTKRAAHGFVMPAASVRTADDARRVRAALNRFGVVILTDAVSAESVTAARRDLCRAIVDMWRDELTPATRDAVTAGANGNLAALDPFRNSKSAFGNCNSAFFYKQPLTTEAYVSDAVDGESIKFDWNTVYANVNLPLLEREPHATAILLAVSEPGALVSVDSAKATSGRVPPPKGLVKPSLTRVHFDRYASETGRIQGMIVADGRVKLGFVPGTNALDVQHLIAQCAGNAALFDRLGFVGVGNARLKRMFDKFWVAPPANAMVLWKQRVIHYEACARAAQPGDSSQCWTYESDAVTLDAPRLRFVVGTHVPVGLPTSAVRRLAAHAVHGMAPATYFAPNAGTRVERSYVVNLRSTSFLKRREMTEAARSRISRALDAVDRVEGGADAVLAALPPLRRRLLCGGALDADFAPLSACGFSADDEAMIRGAHCQDDDNEDAADDAGDGEEEVIDTNDCDDAAAAADDDDDDAALGFSAADFRRFEGARQSGAINMFDARRVAQLSGLPEATVLKILGKGDCYAELRARFCAENEAGDDDDDDDKEAREVDADDEADDDDAASSATPTHQAKRRKQQNKKEEKTAVGQLPQKTFGDVVALDRAKRGGIVLLGTQNPAEYVDGVCKMLAEQKIATRASFDAAPFYVTTTGGRTDTVLPFATHGDSPPVDMGRLIVWRLRFGDCSWIEDYVVNYAAHH